MPWRNQHTERDMENKPDYKIFTPSGCLSPEGMAFYVQGSLNAAETALVRDHLQQCEMCALAVEGYRLSIPVEFNEDLAMLDASFNQMKEEVPEIIDEAIPAVSSNFEGPRFPRLSQNEIREFSASVISDYQRKTNKPVQETKKKAVPGFLRRFRTELIAAAFFVLLITAGRFLFVEMNKSKEQKDFAAVTEPEHELNQPLNHGLVQGSDSNASISMPPAPQAVVKKQVSSEKVAIVRDQVVIETEADVLSEEEALARRVPPLNTNIPAETKTGKSMGYAVSEQHSDQAELVYVEGVKIRKDKRKSGKVKSENDVEEEEVAEPEIFMIVEESPVYPGGDAERSKFLSENLRYPHEASEASVEGTVYVTFIVERDGSLSDIRILRGLGYGLDDEVLRVIRLMPRWTPGKQRGKPVRVQFNLPVKFILNGNLVPEK